MATSRSLNKVMLIGNLTRNPVIHTVGDKQSSVCTFGVATNTTWKDSDNNLKERTEFHNIVAWNKLGEICAQILATGMLVYIEGELRTRVREDESGKKLYRTEIKLNDMKLLDAKGKRGVGVEEAKDLANNAGSNVKKEEDVSEEEPKEISKKESTTDSGEDLF